MPEPLNEHIKFVSIPGTHRLNDQCFRRRLRTVSYLRARERKIGVSRGW